MDDWRMQQQQQRRPVSHIGPIQSYRIRPSPYPTYQYQQQSTTIPVQNDTVSKTSFLFFIIERSSMYLECLLSNGTTVYLSKILSLSFTSTSYVSTSTFNAIPFFQFDVSIFSSNVLLFKSTNVLSSFRLLFNKKFHSYGIG